MNATIDTLIQLSKGPVWDGNLISKHDRDELVKNGWVARTLGFNFLTEDGVKACAILKILPV